MLQCVSQCVAVFHLDLTLDKIDGITSFSVLQRVAVCCSVLQCIAVYYSVLQCVAECVAMCVAVRVTVCCSVSPGPYARLN